jgi:hypothetical protein
MIHPHTLVMHSLKSTVLRPYVSASNAQRVITVNHYVYCQEVRPSHSPRHRRPVVEARRPRRRCQPHRRYSRHRRTVARGGSKVRSSILLLVGARPTQDLGNRHQQNPQVESERPLVDVFEIHPHPLLEVHSASAARLP